jgi:hypothetical protein
MNFKYIAGISLLLLLGSCKHEINPDEIFSKEINFTLTIHERNNSTFDSTKRKIITKDSKTIEKLRSWITKNSNGWKSSIASWATPDISVIGTDFRLLVYKDGAVIGYTNKKGKPIQLVKKVNTSELTFLTEK